MVQCGKVAIVQTAATDQLPNALYRIELGTVGRQKVETKVIGDFLPPALMKRGMMITSIVDNDHRLSPTPAAYTFELPEELPTGACVKHAFGWRHHQLAILEPHRAEKADALSSRSVQTDWIIDFRRNPQATTRAMLLEMHFIHRPQIDFDLSRQEAEFFCVRLATEGRLERLGAGVCATESPVAGKAAGIAGPSSLRPAGGQQTRTTSDHPTFGSATRTGLDSNARRPPLEPIAWHPSDWDVPVAHPQTNRPVQRIQSAAPNSRQCGENRLKDRRPGGRSIPGRRAAHHGVGDRSARNRCAGSHLGVP